MNKHYAKFYGNVISIKYVYGRVLGDHSSDYRDSKLVVPIREIVKHELLWEGLIDHPLIEENELMQIPTIEDEITVTKRVRKLE